jgi:hypothetical protein
VTAYNNYQEEGNTMGNLMKMLVAIILVLSLSILAQPQHGACATPVEYDLIGNGKIITTKSVGLLDATIALSLDQLINYPDDNYPEQIFISGMLTITVPQQNKEYNYPYTAYININELSIFITTESTATLSGTISSDGVQMSLVLQIPKEGTTGKFVIPPQ